MYERMIKETHKDIVKKTKVLLHWIFSYVLLQMYYVMK